MEPLMKGKSDSVEKIEDAVIWRTGAQTETHCATTSAYILEKKGEGEGGKWRDAWLR